MNDYYKTLGVDKTLGHNRFSSTSPDTLTKPAPVLKEIPLGSSASQIFDIVIDNYGTYNEVAARLTGWQKWYEEQKKIFDSVK